MMNITVNLGGNRTVVVDGTETYTGTRTGGNSLGNRNVETYDVVIMGVACVGTWDGDARHNTEVRCPQELRAQLLKLWKQREDAARRLELSRMSRADREYFERCGLG